MTLKLSSFLLLLAIFSDEVLGKDIIVYVKKEDPFVDGLIHVASGVSFTVIDPGFGELSDIKCTKSAQGTGVAKCRFRSANCNRNSSDENTYEIQLQSSFSGFMLNPNVFSIMVKGCSVVPPDEFTFVYKPKNKDIYIKSRDSLAQVARLAGGGTESISSFWSSQSSIDSIKAVASSYDSTTARRNLIDSNNLAVLYAGVANSYESESEEYKKYQSLAKSYEKYSVLTANLELAKTFGENPFKNQESIKVTPNLSDYIDNITKLKKSKDQLILDCLNCSTDKLEKGIELISESTALNSVSVSALKELANAKEKITE
ncbi:hypothetical protein N474_07450 [Pseudoalteromonas luteoviolacea CPMOR-2]|uniref:Uncharacterized protein n=1 Tax=Pseudoalteromonas luteoviolacea DSM 6061 TaxID=1365250 RepID=A0A166X2V4_9GAMM|nr:hypothetical protein [Pseudoalteromonas luteoviolacea]KZN39538.1 hypothetical protein N475_14060 [Pseudoalteromonas luteoviolacea DSM 6061]KZN57807.1 hypothetical protein N474_07450 [Pseudoalteromonas luteoviolacea CPMOR-2]MBE0388410.1 hypothetical protein [Pseudoalteromonas luteoviolacea DSM 6061]